MGEFTICLHTFCSQIGMAKDKQNTKDNILVGSHRAQELNFATCWTVITASLRSDSVRGPNPVSPSPFLALKRWVGQGSAILPFRETPQTSSYLQFIIWLR